MNDMQKNVLELIDNGTLLCVDAYESAIDNQTALGSALPKGILQKDAILNNTESVVDVKKTKKIIAKDFDGVVDIDTADVKACAKTTDSFIDLFSSKYEQIKNILLSHQGLKNTVSISTALKSTGGEETVIGMIYDIFTTKSGKLMAEIEDGSGRMKVFFTERAGTDAERVLVDDVIGMKGRISREYMFVDDIIWPDVPASVTRTISDPLSAVFISDLHYGSKEFIQKIESRFIKWINSTDKDASRVKYLFVGGDVADGIGIYPGQEDDLQIKDIFGQYKKFEELFETIPEHIQVMVCAGNHDALGLAEPQPKLPRKFLPTIYDFKNLHLTQNPSNIRIHGRDAGGINVLMYHGYSFTSIIDAVPELRRLGMSEPQHVMKDVLRRRHLAPTYGATVVNPLEIDPLVIRTVPDIFHTGDLHSHAVDRYKSTTLVSSSTFQGQTSFMDRVGHKATPGKITCVELDTRRVIVKDFL